MPPPPTIDRAPVHRRRDARHHADRPFHGLYRRLGTYNGKRMPPPDPSLPWRRSRGLASTDPGTLLILGVSVRSMAARFRDRSRGGGGGPSHSCCRGEGRSRREFHDALMGATRTELHDCLHLAGAAFLTAAMGFTGIPRAFAEWISELQHAANWALLAVLTRSTSCSAASSTASRWWFSPPRDHHPAGEKADST